MRCTLGTAVGLAVAIFLALTFWPETPVTPGPSRAEAQQAPKKEDQPALPRDSNTTAAVEAKLSTRLPEVKFVETPLADVLEYLSDAIQVDILSNKRALEDLGIPTDTQITLQVKHAPVTVRTALELALEQVSGELGYTVRDGLVYITQKFDNDEIQVYNVRDLLKGVPAALTRPGAPAAPGGFGGASAAGGEGAGMGMMSGGLGVGKGTASVELLSAGEAIREVITSTIHPDTWSSVGGVGSLAEFNGLLIVKQSQTVHREIHQLLQMMREEDHAGALSSTRKP